jgi:hypothetical protein
MIGAMLALAASDHSVITTVVNWLDSHQGTSIVLLTIALVVVTTYYAVQNRRMATEMRRANQLASEQREIDQHREQLRELRMLTDDAAAGLSDMWTLLSAFSYAMPRGDPAVSHLSPIEASEPDPQRFIEVYRRLRSARIRLQNRVEWGDTVSWPIAQALIKLQQAYNPVVNEDPHAVRAKESEKAIYAAIASVQDALREVQQTSRARFAPLGLPDARYVSVIVLTIKQRGQRLDDLLTALRAEPGRETTIDGPDHDGRVTVRDDEAAPGEARARLIASLDTGDMGWRGYVELLSAPDSEMEAWKRRARR